MNFEPIIEKVFTVVISAAVGWLISAATKVSNTKLEKAIGELEKRVISPVVARVERLETKADSFATRADVRELISDLKSSMEARQVELRVTMNGIFRELRDLRGRRWESSDDEN
jgi:hypothetical protein